MLGEGVDFAEMEPRTSLSFQVFSVFPSVSLSSKKSLDKIPIEQGLAQISWFDPPTPREPPPCSED